MAELLIIIAIAALIFAAFKSRKKPPAITYHKFSGPNAKEEAAKFLSKIDPESVHNISASGISVEELQAETRLQKKQRTWPTRDSPKSFSDQLRESEIWAANNDIIKGFRLAVTLSLDTPYQYILEASVIYDNPHEIPDVPAQYGVWIPYLGETSIEGTRASHFGPVTDTYAEQVLLPFLAEYRKTIEGNLPDREKFEILNSLGERVDIWRKYIAARGIKTINSLGELWAFRNLTEIKGVGVVKAMQLIERGIYTQEGYKKEGR